MSGVGETVWIEPAAIRFKIGQSRELRGIVPGDWDIERRHPFQTTAKYRAMVERFVEGRPWIKTDLFRDAYARRLARDGRVGRFTTLADLAQDYERRYDPLFASMAKDGFKTEGTKGKAYPLPVFLIGRDGDVFIGNQGNHRLAMAQVLGLDRIAGRIVCRHSLATCR